MSLKRRVQEHFAISELNSDKAYDVLNRIANKFEPGVVNFEDVSPRSGIGHSVGADRYVRSFVTTLESDRGGTIELGVSWTDRKGSGGYIPRDVTANLSYFRGFCESDLIDLRRVLREVGFEKS
jgi:hypothetical protein